MNDNLEEVRSALSRVRSRLMQKANVVATGIGYKVKAGRRTGRLSIICSVEKKVALERLDKNDRVPKVVDGVVTDVMATGPISVFQNRTERLRPAPGGVSIGHELISAGTLGCLVRKKDELYILSNNHVLANSNDASHGDAILQPGLADAADAEKDEIARLDDFVPIIFNEESRRSRRRCRPARLLTSILNRMASVAGSQTRFSYSRVQSKANLVDCAIARPISDEDVINEIVEIGVPQGIAKGELGMKVRKSGRSTGLTEGEIQQVDVSVRVNFGPGRTALFEDQLMAGEMSQPGDSGSVVLDHQNNIVGLLFAGGVHTTLINRIEHVFDALDLDVA
jgi:hypothetical protein